MSTVISYYHESVVVAKANADCYNGAMKRLYNVGRQTGGLTLDLSDSQELITATVVTGGDNPIVALPSGTLITLDGYSVEPGVDTVSVRWYKGRYIPVV